MHEFMRPCVGTQELVCVRQIERQKTFCAVLLYCMCRKCDCSAFSIFMGQILFRVIFVVIRMVGFIIIVNNFITV